MKLPIKKATATARVVIVMNSAVAAAVRHGSQGGIGVTLGVLAVASATFAVIGALVSRRLPGWLLSVAFAVLMFLVAVYTVVHTVVGG